MKKRTWKIFLLALALCLVLACAWAEPENAVPAVGDKIQGFTVTAVEDFDLVDAKVVYLVHDKTEGPVVWIANDDTERSFLIGFRTHYDNDKGVPHVFEHAALSGSESYPDPQLFFNMISNTCQTEMNATTYVDRTLYKCASISDKQLLKFADVYLAGVFEPLVVTDEHAMKREAYRYQMDSADGDLELVGTVYSEMLGNYYASESGYVTQRLAYPGSWYGTCTGGKPGVIETMTQQDLIDFHNTYYQPSNALTLLYGDLNLEDFLGVIGGYYDRYDKVEVSTEDPGYEPFTGYSEVSAEVCASADAQEETDLEYFIPLRGIPDDELIVVSDFLSRALYNEGSAMYRELMEKFPNSTFELAVVTDGAEPMMEFILYDAGNVTASEFSAAVQQGIADVLAEGIRYDALKSIAKSLKQNLALTRESSGLGISLSQSFLQMYVLSGQLDDYLNNVAILEQCEEWLESGRLETVITEQLVEPADSRVIAITKIPGKQEEETAAAEQRLADKKAAMTQEEIDQVVADTKDYEEWSNASAQVSMINEVNVLTREELPEEVATTSVNVTDQSGVRYITSSVENCEIVDATLYFRADWVPTEQLQRYDAMASLLGNLETAEHSDEEIASLITEYGISITTGTLEDGNDQDVYIPVFKVEFSCLKEDLPQAVALVKELLTETAFEDYDLIRYVDSMMIYEDRVILGQYLPHYMILALAQAASSESALYSYYLSDLPEMKYMEQVTQMEDAELQAETVQWQELLTGLYNREGLQITVVSDDEGITQAISLLDEMADAMPYSVRTAVNYGDEMEQLPSRIGVKIPGSANYLAQSIATKETGYTYSPELDILSSLVYDQILIPVLRYRNGVYSPMNDANEDDVYVLAYRDPSVTRTFNEVIPSIAGLVAEMEVDEATLNNLVVSGYTSLAKAQGPITTALEAVRDVLNNTNSQQEKLEKMRVYKELTVEKLLANAGLYDVLAEKGVKVTAAPASVIEANADQYDLIITWYIE